VPDLEPLTLPTADAGTDAWSSWLTTRTSAQLDTAREMVAALKADRPRRAAELLERWNELNLALANAFSASSLIQQVHPDAAVREQAEQAQIEAHKLLTDLSLDREIYDLMVVDDAARLPSRGCRPRRRDPRPHPGHQRACHGARADLRAQHPRRRDDGEAPSRAARRSAAGLGRRPRRR
jgi:thimet oligopeptidase